MNRLLTTLKLEISNPNKIFLLLLEERKMEKNEIMNETKENEEKKEETTNESKEEKKVIEIFEINHEMRFGKQNFEEFDKSEYATIDISSDFLDLSYHPHIKMGGQYPLNKNLTVITNF
jgi:hypothetical protein